MSVSYLYMWCGVGVRLTSLVIVFAICLGFWALQMTEDFRILHEDNSRLKNGDVQIVCPTSTKNNNNITETAEEEEDEPLNHLLMDYVALYEHIDEQRRLMERAAQVNYSHYYRDLFYVSITTTNETVAEASRGKLAWFNSQQPQGWNTLKARLKAKILTVQEGLLLDKETKENPCPSHSTAAAAANRMTSHVGPVKWIHAIGGMSSSAGHGNLEGESYGAVMNAALLPLFQSMGIDLETRVYGMSARPSAPEMALCQEAILGTDVDMMTYDHALTDGRETNHFEYWMQRASIMRSHPVLIANYLDRRRYQFVVSRLYRQHTNLPLLVANETVIAQMEEAVPDTVEGLDSPLRNLPPMLKYLRCGSVGLEGTGPCKFRKFRHDVCPERRWMVSWHPGYKRLALMGNLYALFLVDALQEAVQELQHEMLITTTNDTTSNNTKVTLVSVQQRLQELEEEREQQIKQIHSVRYQPRLGKGTSQDVSDLFPGVNASWFYQSRSLCRTMRLPSQQRYKGISTGHPVRYDGLVPVEGMEHEQIAATFGKPPNFDNNNSNNHTTISNSSTTNGSSLLVENAVELELGYDELVRYSQRTCENFTTNLDYSDYLYVTDTWRKAILPSTAEVQEYFPEDSSSSSPEFHGIVIVCFLDCKLQTKACYGDELRGGWHRLEFQLNGLPVVGLTPFINEECGVLKHEGGLVFPPRDDGKYDLRVRINPKKANGVKILQISSIVLI